MCKIAVVILNYLNYEDTIECMNSLLNISEVWNYIEGVVIVDNCSTNESYNILSDMYMNMPKVKIVKTTQNFGFAKGNNFGISIAREKYNTDFILCVNNDTLFHDSQIFKMLMDRYWQSPSRNAILGSAIRLSDGSVQSMCTSALGIIGTILYSVTIGLYSFT